MNTYKYARSTLAVALLGALAAQGALACNAPKAPTALPNGETAPMQTMLDAKRNVETYVQQVSAYMKCENDGVKLQEVKARQTEVLKWFNAEVRAYKAVNTPAMASNRH